MENRDVQLPEITHQLINPELASIIDIPDGKLIETVGLHGISQLQAVKVEPMFKIINGSRTFQGWKEVGDNQFKMMISPAQRVIRLELYDPLMFSILLEQLLTAGYSILTSGEDVEFTNNPQTHGGWLGWAHLYKSISV